MYEYKDWSLPRTLGHLASADQIGCFTSVSSKPRQFAGLIYEFCLARYCAEWGRWRI